MTNTETTRTTRRCRWCGSHGIGRTPAALNKCRARLDYGRCEEWHEGMAPWPQFIELDEYVDEQTCDVRRRPLRGSRWTHVKTQRAYQVVCVAKVEADPSQQVVVYVGDQDDVWTRPLSEFTDGRFKPE